MKMNPAYVYQTVKFALVAKGVAPAEAEQRTRAKATEAMDVANAALIAAVQKTPGQMHACQQAAIDALAAWATANA